MCLLWSFDACCCLDIHVRVYAKAAVLGPLPLQVAAARCQWQCEAVPALRLQSAHYHTHLAATPCNGSTFSDTSKTPTALPIAPAIWGEKVAHVKINEHHYCKPMEYSWNMYMLHVLKHSQTAWNSENRCDFPNSFRRKELQHFAKTGATKVSESIHLYN